MFKAGFPWLQERIDRLRRERRDKQALLRTVEQVVDIADSKIRLAHRYRQALLPSLKTATTYCRQLVASFPGPFQLGPASYHDTPLVKALFASVEEMEETLRQTHSGKEVKRGQEAFALLTMSKEEKTIFSHKKQGDAVLRDVAMRAVNFVEHRIIAPTPDLQVTLSQLEERGLEVLATVAMEKIAGMRAELAELRERRERLSSMHRILGGKQRTFELFAQPDAKNIEEIGKVKQLLARTEQEIEAARVGLETPDDVLGHLQRIMDEPAAVLEVQKQSLQLNWMNILSENSNEGDSNEITLAEMVLNQELHRSAVLVRFDVPGEA